MNAQENRGNLTVQRSDCISSGAKPHTFCLLVIPGPHPGIRPCGMNRIAQGTAWIPRCTRSAGCPGRCSRRCSRRSRNKVREKRVFAHRVLGTQKMMATKANRFVTTKETHSDVRVWPGKHSLFIAFSWLDVFLAVGECFRVGRGETCCFRNMPGALLQAVLQSRERKGHSWCRACGTSYLHERGCIGKRRNGRNR